MKSIPLTQGKFALVDDEDYEWLNQWKWCVHKSGRNFRAVRREQINKKAYFILMHREIMGNPDGMTIDHINGNALDNRRSNLRVCTLSENLKNKHTLNSSGYKGVYVAPNGRFHAYFSGNGKRRYLGVFYKIEDAARAWDRVAKESYGIFACLNFPD